MQPTGHTIRVAGKHTAFRKNILKRIMFSV